jgi:hypothetical protein
MRKQITVTLTLETDCDDDGLLAEAVCSELCGQVRFYHCTEALPNGEDGEVSAAEFEIVAAEGGGCKVDADWEEA